MTEHRRIAAPVRAVAIPVLAKPTRYLSITAMTTAPHADSDAGAANKELQRYTREAYLLAPLFRIRFDRIGVSSWRSVDSLASG